MTTKTPTRAGQLVRSSRGEVGITTDRANDRVATIPVMFFGWAYPVRTQVHELVVIDLDALQDEAKEALSEYDFYYGQFKNPTRNRHADRLASALRNFTKDLSA